MSFIIQRSRSELSSCMCHCDPPPGTEELAHLKMVCTIAHQLTRGMSMEELKDPGVRYGHHKIIKDKTLLHLPGTGEEQRF